MYLAFMSAESLRYVSSSLKFLVIFLAQRPASQSADFEIPKLQNKKKYTENINNLKKKKKKKKKKLRTLMKSFVFN